MMKLTLKNSSNTTAQILSRSRTCFASRYSIIKKTLTIPQYTLGRPSLKFGSTEPPMLPATCRMASSRPFRLCSLEIFRRKPVGNLLTLDWVDWSAAKAGNSRTAVIPMARTEKKAIRTRSRKNFFQPPQRQI